MSYKIYAGVQTDVDDWDTKVCIYDPGDISDTKKLISPTLTREVGKAGSLEFTIPLGNVAHSALQKLRTTVEVQQDGKSIWQGRVMSHEQDFMLRQKTYCEGELAYLNDSCVPPYTASRVTFYEFLSWICENHNGMTNAYKAFKAGTVKMDDDFVVPVFENCYLNRTNGRYYYDDDDDRVYDWDLVDSAGNKLVDNFYELLKENEKPSELSMELGQEKLYKRTFKGGFLLSRTGDNKFKVRLNAVYANEKTWASALEVSTASITCATLNMEFGRRAAFVMDDAEENSSIKITKTNGKYTVKIDGVENTICKTETVQPVYDFTNDEQDVAVTWDMLQSALIDKYGGYLRVRHEKNSMGTPCRYLDYLQDIPDKSAQPIAFGTNLLDLTSYVKAEDITTRVIAVGKQTSGWFFWEHTDTIKATSNDLAAQKLFGIITKVIVIDGTSSTLQSLQDAADEELAKSNVRYLDGLTIKAVDLKDAGIDIGRLEFGKKAHIYSYQHGVDTWQVCTKLVEPLDAPDKKEFTFGTEFSSISDLQALSARKAGAAYDMSRALKGYAISKGG